MARATHPLPGVTYGPGWRPRPRHRPRALRRVNAAPVDDVETIERLVAVVREAHPGVSADQAQAWLLGEHNMGEDDRVLAAAARRAGQLQARAAWLMSCVWTGADLTARLPTTLNWRRPKSDIDWKAP